MGSFSMTVPKLVVLFWEGQNLEEVGTSLHKQVSKVGHWRLHLLLVLSSALMWMTLPHTLKPSLLQETEIPWNHKPK